MARDIKTLFDARNKQALSSNPSVDAPIPRVLWKLDQAGIHYANVQTCTKPRFIDCANEFQQIPKKSHLAYRILMNSQFFSDVLTDSNEFQSRRACIQRRQQRGA